MHWLILTWVWWCVCDLPPTTSCKLKSHLLVGELASLWGWSCVKSPSHLHNGINMYEGNRLTITYLSYPPSLLFPKILHFTSAPPPPSTLNPFTHSPSDAAHVSLLAFILFAQPFSLISHLFLCLLFTAFVQPSLMLSPTVLYLYHQLAFLLCSGSQLKNPSSCPSTPWKICCLFHPFILYSFYHQNTHRHT